ncbi:MAG: hypothetical protein JOZ94_13290 [Xanthobacteraceae bacterium]|nr:hypothetical protein [Xanthobacteraceae bacterium]MBV9632669.1 hypothetical protein [Xanthobacteraceae bacterium]
MKAPALLTIAAAVGLLGMRGPAVANPNTDLSVPRFPPLVLYVARGAGGCGDGCDEWIAAEGGFDIGSAQRLRTFLTQFSDRIPPIYFQSPGGIQEEAIAIGRLMRERGVTAGVGRTLPYGCAPGKDGEDRCLTLKRSGLPLAGELQSTGASCSSACVYALLGAQVRLVPPDARLGVHASRRVRVYPDGRVTRLPGDDQTQLGQATNELKQYVQEMGIDVGLIDTAFKTKFSDAYFLTRNEIVQFGIDTRTFQETRWTVLDSTSRRPSVFKLVVETHGDEGATTSLIQLACANAGEIQIGYVRAAAPNEIAPALVRAIAGDHRMTFARPGPAVHVTGLDNDTPYEPRSLSARPEFFEAAISAGSMVISESSLRPDSPHVLRLATAGLPEAIATLRKSCRPQSMASAR